MQDEKRRRAGGIGLALRRREAAVERDIAFDALGLARAREFERRSAAEAIADHHGRLVSARARFLQACKQQLLHARPVLIELRRLSLPGVGIDRAVALAIEIEREGLVAERGDHVGALLLVCGHAAPRMNDDDEPFGSAGRLGAIAFEGFAIDAVGNGFTRMSGHRIQHHHKCQR
jgi:hypothetical protein